MINRSTKNWARRAFLPLLLMLIVAPPTQWIASRSVADEPAAAAVGKKRQEAKPKTSDKSSDVSPEKPNSQDKSKSIEKWVRVVLDEKKKPTSLQTAVVRYQGIGANKHLKVDLIGAIHVGDKAYYEKLNKEFEQYDSLLYELVAPEGTKIPRGGRKGGSGHPVGALQDGMKQWLDLEHQLTIVDYTKENFIHADMSPEQFSQSMKDRDESFTKLFFRLMGRSMAMQGRMQAQGKASPDAQILAALFSSDRSRQLKIAMAGQFDEMESMLTGFGGPEGTTIIAGRNEVALKVLRERIEKGEKLLGIFYGAGHMVDMDKRLRKDFALEPTKTRWIDAWDLTRK